jgi:acyl-CoA hydrolase
MKKNVCGSLVTMTELILPNDTNNLGNLLGGRLMHWIDIAGAMAASRHSNKVVATVEVDNLEFKKPVRMGEILIINAKLTWVGNTSMEVMVESFAEDIASGVKILANRAFLIYVALDDAGKACQVPELELNTDAEKEEMKRAQERRKVRLLRAEKTQKE